MPPLEPASSEESLSTLTRSGKDIDLLSSSLAQDCSDDSGSSYSFFCLFFLFSLSLSFVIFVFFSVVTRAALNLEMQMIASQDCHGASTSVEFGLPSISNYLSANCTDITCTLASALEFHNCPSSDPDHQTNRGNSPLCMRMWFGEAMCIRHETKETIRVGVLSAINETDHFDFLEDTVHVVYNPHIRAPVVMENEGLYDDAHPLSSLEVGHAILSVQTLDRRGVCRIHQMPDRDFDWMNELTILYFRSLEEGFTILLDVVKVFLPVIED